MIPITVAMGGVLQWTEGQWREGGGGLSVGLLSYPGLAVMSADFRTLLITVSLHLIWARENNFAVVYRPR